MSVPSRSEGRVEIIKVELERIEDLALLASSLPVPVINYSAEEDVAFLLFMGAGGRALLYFSRLGGQQPSRFVHVDKVSARVSFGDQVSFEPNHVSLPVLRVKSHDLGSF